MPKSRLSAKIAERLAELRERQQARAAAAARAHKAQEAKRREEEKAAAAAAILAAAPKHGTQWAYEGELGPANWSKINVDWAKCGSGNRQSPIDIRDGIKVNLEQIGFDYHPSSFNEINNGHTINVTVGGGNFITVGNETYELQGFHFHRPSEERINGKGTEMVMHMVHKSVDGKIAIVAVLLERGQPHRLMQTVWDNLPLEKNETGGAFDRDRPERRAAGEARVLHLHGLADRAAVHRRRAVAGVQAAAPGLAGADGAVLAPVSAQCAAGADGGGADDQGIELIAVAPAQAGA